MKSRKNTIKRGGAAEQYEYPSSGSSYEGYAIGIDLPNLVLEGGSKRKSRKSRKSKKSKKTKKGRGAYEGGKKKCPKPCHRKTRRTRKGLKHRKN